MLLALVIMIAGIGVGLLLRFYGNGASGSASSGGIAEWTRRRIGVILLVTVCLLLFVMGIRVATDPMIIANLYKIGGVALVIFALVALGTLLAAWLGAKWIDRKRRT